MEFDGVELQAACSSRIAVIERAEATAAEVDRVVIGVHRAISDEARNRIRSTVHDSGIGSIAYIADLAGFMAAGRLTDDIVRTRHRYSAESATAAIATLREQSLIDDAGHPAPRLATVLDAVESIRIVTATREWESSAHLEALAAGAAVMMRRGRGPLVEPYRKLYEPDDPVGVLWHRLIGLRYARADAHAAAWEVAGLTAGEVVDLTAAWHGDDVESPQQSLVDRRMLTSSGGITEDGSRLRDEIEGDTNQRSEPVYQALDAPGWAGWMAALAELPPHP